VNQTGVQRLFGAQSKPSQLFDVSAGRDIAAVDGSIFWQAGWPNPVTVGAGAESHIQFIDAATGKPHGAPCRHFMGMPAGMSADGTRMVTWSPGYRPESRPPGVAAPEGYLEAFAILWDTATGKPIHEFNSTAEQPLGALRLTPDGQRLLIISQGGPPLAGKRPGARLLVWDAAKRDWLYPPIPLASNISLPAMSADGKLVAVFDNDRRMGVLVVATGAWRLPPTQMGEHFTMVEFHPQGTHLLVAMRSEMQLLALDTSPPVRMPLGEKVDIAAFSPDGQWVAVAGGKTAQVWATFRGEPISPLLVHDGYVTQVQFDDRGDTLVTCASDGAICRWDLRPDTRPRAVLDAECQLISARQASPDGHLLPVDAARLQQNWQLRSSELGGSHDAPPPLAPPASVAGESVSTPPRGTARRSNDEVGRAFQLKYLKTAAEDFHAGDLIPLFTALEYPRSRKEILSAAEPTSPIGRVRYLVERLGDDPAIRTMENRSPKPERIGRAYVISTSAVSGGTNYLSPGQMHINMWALPSAAYPPGRYRVSVQWLSAGDEVLGEKALELDLQPPARD
jgi:WD40 repeat protein